MSRDAKADEVGQWLYKVHRDLQIADLTIGAAPPLLDDTVFHCQQAVEKALKALLVHRGRRPPKIHDIRQLGRRVAVTDEDLGELAKSARWLTPFGAEFRYPGDAAEPSIKDAREALDTARALVAAIEERIALG
jgi:HEPN domain-containing protein